MNARRAHVMPMKCSRGDNLIITVEIRMWVVHFTDKNGKATVSICQSRDAAFKSAHGLREHFCAVHYISGPNGARIELKEILDWCSQQARNVG